MIVAAVGDGCNALFSQRDVRVEIVDLVGDLLTLEAGQPASRPGPPAPRPGRRRRTNLVGAREGLQPDALRGGPRSEQPLELADHVVGQLDLAAGAAVEDPDELEDRGVEADSLDLVAQLA